jgi:membrane-associated protease RseP (regulator of RpoE activity)
MKRRHAPWWLYVLTASFCCYFALTLCLEFRGPEIVGILPDFSKGGMVLLRVSPGSPGARAGLQAGDRVLAAEGQAIHSQHDWWGVRANLEVGSPRRLEIERGDKRLDVVVTLGRLAWSQQGRSTQLTSVAQYAGSLVSLLLALVVAFSRPHDSTALLGAWLLASTAVGGPPGYGFAAAWRHLPVLLGALLWQATP